MAPWWERQDSHLSFPLTKQILRPCWAPGWVLAHMEWKEAWALFCRSSQTRKGGRPRDTHSITSVHAKGTHPPALFLHYSDLGSWTTPCSGLWAFALSIFPASTLPKPPLSARPVCLAKSYSSFRFRLRCHFFQENAADLPNLRSRPFRAPMTPLNQPLPLCGIFL